jgi:hypothetical protein
LKNQTVPKKNKIMALIVQGATFVHQYISSFLQSTPRKSPTALKLGVLSSAQINAAAGMLPLSCF